MFTDTTIPHCAQLSHRYALLRSCCARAFMQGMINSHAVSLRVYCVFVPFGCMCAQAFSLGIMSWRCWEAPLEGAVQWRCSGGSAARLRRVCGSNDASYGVEDDDHRPKMAQRNNEHARTGFSGDRCFKDTTGPSSLAAHCVRENFDFNHTRQTAVEGSEASADGSWLMLLPSEQACHMCIE